jgi:hypothetical protein
MYKPFGLGIFVAIIGPALFIGSSIADAQIGGALQYPPASVGGDAQPPPPARMAPESVSPRRIELGVSGSSQLPADYLYRVHPRSDIDRPRTQSAPLLRASPLPPPTAGGN